MNEQNLKQLLEETHPVLPGQESRAWTKTREHIFAPAPSARLYFAQLLVAYPLRFIGASAALGAVVAISLSFVSSSHGNRTASAENGGIFPVSYSAAPVKSQDDKPKPATTTNTTPVPNSL